MIHEMLGRPPVFVFHGHHADIDSSSPFYNDAVILSLHCRLNSSAACKKFHHVSDSFASLSSHIDGMSLRYSLNLFSPMNFPKFGDWMILRQLFTSLHTEISGSSDAHSSRPLQLYPAAAIMMPIATRNSFSVNGWTFAPLALEFSMLTALLSLASFAFQSYVNNCKK
jgi:hypothetical protein